MNISNDFFVSFVLPLRCIEMRDIMVTVIRSWSLSIHICSEELAEQLIRVATYCAVTFLNPGSAITIIRVEAWSIRLVDIYANGRVARTNVTPK